MQGTGGRCRAEDGGPRTEQAGDGPEPKATRLKQGRQRYPQISASSHYPGYWGRSNKLREPEPKDGCPLVGESRIGAAVGSDAQDTAGNAHWVPGRSNKVPTIQRNVGSAGIGGQARSKEQGQVCHFLRLAGASQGR